CTAFPTYYYGDDYYTGVVFDYW
nr:immunoglobulin heavy chain junction region [Macaca mulatta]